MNTETKSLGQVAFETYHSQFYWAEGQQPKWIGQPTKDKWERAAQAVADHIAGAEWDCPIHEDLARMVTAYVEGGIKLGTDWRNGLASIIRLRMDRRRVQPQAAQGETPTPETDANVFSGQADWAEDNAMSFDCVQAYFARVLERQRNSARAELAQEKAVREEVETKRKEFEARLKAVEKQHIMAELECRENDAEIARLRKAFNDTNESWGQTTLKLSQATEEISKLTAKLKAAEDKPASRLAEAERLLARTIGIGKEIESDDFLSDISAHVDTITRFLK